MTKNRQAEKHLSDDDAIQITNQECEPKLAGFVSALGMHTPVSTATAALLLEHMIKEQTSGDTALVADQMRQDGWEKSLTDGENLNLLAERALAYLASEDGVKLFNFFVQTFAKTSGVMFE
jgi:hypothetical protein